MQHPRLTLLSLSECCRAQAEGGHHTVRCLAGTVQRHPGGPAGAGLADTDAPVCSSSDGSSGGSVPGHLRRASWQGCWGLVAVPYPAPHARQPSIPDPLPALCHRDCLQAVPGVVAGKENALAEDSRVLAAAGLALEESCRQLEGLRQQKAAAEGGSGGAAQKDGEPAGLCCAVLYCVTNAGCCCSCAAASEPPGG